MPCDMPILLVAEYGDIRNQGASVGKAPVLAPLRDRKTSSPKNKPFSGSA